MCCFDTQKSNFCPNMVVAHKKQQNATKSNKKQQKTTKTTKNNKLKNNKNTNRKKSCGRLPPAAPAAGPSIAANSDCGEPRLRRTPFAFTSTVQTSTVRTSIVRKDTHSSSSHARKPATCALL